MDGLFSLSFKIDTHEYDGATERWVTQADLGLIIKCENYLMSSDSWEACWLLQAKRAYPDARNPPTFSDTSRFAAHDPAQHVRIQQLQQALGHDFVSISSTHPGLPHSIPLTAQNLPTSGAAGLLKTSSITHLALSSAKSWDRRIVRSRVGSGWHRHPTFLQTSRLCTVKCSNLTHHLHGFWSAISTPATDFAIS